MTLDEAVNLAAKELPEDWHISIEVQRHSGYVDVFYDGDDVPLNLCPDFSLSDQIVQAVEYAKKERG